MLSGNLATMVPGVPYAIAAKFAYPDRVAIAMVGDGAMQMGGMAEMLTAAKYYKTLGGPAPDRAGAQQRGPQPGHLGAAGDGGRPAFEASQEIPYVDYAAFAELIGLRGIKLSHSSEIEERLARRAERRPSGRSSARSPIPTRPPLPPHITFEQAENFAKSIVADPAAGLPGAVESVREKVHEFLPGR